MESIVMWIDLAMKVGILIVAVLALIKWFHYVNLKKAEIGSKYQDSPRKQMSEQADFRPSVKPETVFENVLRKSDLVESVEEEEEISADEFYKAVNRKTQNAG